MTNKTALVTGAGRGIGKALAIELAHNNCYVLMCGRNENDLQATQEEIKRAGFSSEYFVADITKAEQVNAMVAGIKEKTDVLDYLINNAGVGSFSPLTEASENDFDKVFNTNVKGSFLLLNKLVPMMKGKGAGHIVTIASDVSKRVFENGSIYCSSKYAQHALLTALRKEVRPYGVKVGIIYPGLTNSYFNDTQADTHEKKDWLQGQDIADAMMYMLNAPARVQVDEIVIHPMIQADY